MEPVSTKKISAGYYRGTYKGKAFMVSKQYNEYWKEWEWISELMIQLDGYESPVNHNDPMPTKREAILQAMEAIDYELNNENDGL